MIILIGVMISLLEMYILDFLAEVLILEKLNLLEIGNTWGVLSVGHLAIILESLLSAGSCTYNVQCFIN